MLLLLLFPIVGVTAAEARETEECNIDFDLELAISEQENGRETVWQKDETPAMDAAAVNQNISPTSTLDSEERRKKKKKKK